MTIHCIECTDIPDGKMSQYIAHKISLKKKLESKHKHRAPSQSPSVDVAPAVAAV